MSSRQTILCALLCALTLAAVAAPATIAIVPPKDCRYLTVKHHRYNIKADQMPCTDARRYSTAYLTSVTRKPKGFRCVKYDPRDTKLAFRCTKGTKAFFAIRR